MKKFIYYLWRQNHRYLIVGLSIYLFELLVIVVAQRLGASSVVAVGIAFWVGLVMSFTLQRIVTFKDKRTHHRVLISQSAAFSALVLFNFCFTLLVVKILSPTVPAVVSRTIAIAITTIWNFYLYKHHIFRGASISEEKPDGDRQSN